MKHTFKLENLAATGNLAKNIARIIVPNFIITLNGNLGAGKTTLTREILCALGISGTIKSPTFTLVEPYILPEYSIYHFDLYRFSDPEEWFDSGFDEYFTTPHLCFIEWAKNAQGLIPTPDWNLNISYSDNEQRELEITALTTNGILCLEKLITAAAN